MTRLLAAPLSVDVYAACYDLLARLYLGGPGALRRELLPPVDPLLDALELADPRWPVGVGELLRCHDDPDELGRAESAYLQCVALPIPGRYVPPYASVYLDDGVLWGNSTFEVLRLYEAEGLSWQQNRLLPGGDSMTVRAPDHVGVEFAFLALATNRRSRKRAGPERRRRLAAFLQDHSTRWLPAYRDALAAIDAGPTLYGWTAWAVELVQSDLDRTR